MKHVVKVQVNILSDSFPIENGLKQRGALSPLPLFCHQKAGQNQDLRTANRSFETVSHFKYLGRIIINKNLLRRKLREV
jgi:hypothetical protein